MSRKKIYIIAGEASGDLHGAHLIEAIKKEYTGDLDFFGVGGSKIKETGAQDFLDIAKFHVNGFTEAIRKLPHYQKALGQILTSVKKQKPDVVVLIDNPGFNLLLASKIAPMGIPVVYYITPQIWAWGQKRIEKIKKYIRKVLVVFEFEKRFYEKAGVDVSFVGHPLLDILKKGTPTAESTKLASEGPLVTLMPGSRKMELKRVGPIIMGAAQKIKEKMPQVRFALIKAPTLNHAAYEKFLKPYNLPLTLVEKDCYGVIQLSTLVVVCSGTATLECGILGTPMIVTNKVSHLTYFAAKNLVTVKYLGLPNILLDKPAFPEFIQYEATPEKISAKAVEILQNPSELSRMKKDLQAMQALLGSEGATTKAAKEILAVIASEAKQSPRGN